jgi:hypothetical protein
MPPHSLEWCPRQQSQQTNVAGGYLRNTKEQRAAKGMDTDKEGGATMCTRKMAKTNMVIHDSNDRSPRRTATTLNTALDNRPDSRLRCNPLWPTQKISLQSQLNWHWPGSRCELESFGGWGSSSRQLLRGGGTSCFMCQSLGSGVTSTFITEELHLSNIVTLATPISARWRWEASSLSKPLTRPISSSQPSNSLLVPDMAQNLLVGCKQAQDGLSKWEFANTKCPFPVVARIFLGCPSGVMLWQWNVILVIPALRAWGCMPAV